MKKLLLLLGVLGVTCAGVLAESPVIVGASSLFVTTTSSNGFTELIAPTDNTSGVYLKTIYVAAPPNTGAYIEMNTTTPTAPNQGKVILGAQGWSSGCNLNSTVEYYLPPGAGLWVYTGGAGVVVALTWDTP